MFVDASVIVAILDDEHDSESLALRLVGERTILTSPLALWEATIALARGKERSIEEAGLIVERFIERSDVEIVPVTAEIGALAVDASRRFGRGRHPAGLNFGDCFAYACARHHGVPLLFKSDDFPQTDIKAA